ncbi:hypothetical protein AAK938_07390 [Aerococcaceae bacterium 50-4]
MVELIKNSKQHEKDSNIYSLSMIIIYLLITAYSIFQNSVIYNIFLLTIIFFLFILNREKMVTLMLTLLPFYSAFSYTNILLIALILYVIKYYKKINISSSIIMGYILVLWEALHFALLKIDIGFFLTFSLILLWISIIAFDRSLVSKLNIEKLVVYFSISLVILGILLLIEIQSDNQITSIFQSGIRLGTLQFGNSIFNVNPNTLALYATTSLCMLLSLDFNSFNKYFRSVLVIGTIFIGILTYSRTFIFASIFIIFYILFSSDDIKMKFYILLIIFLLFLILLVKTPFLIENLMQRFEVDDLSNSRIDIFNLYNRMLSSNLGILLFGVGLQNYQLKVNIDVSIHNPLQEVIVTWGLVGFIIVAIFLIFVVKNIFKSTKGAIKFLPIIAFFITIQSSRLFTTPVNLLLFLVVIFSCISTTNDDYTLRKKRSNIYL